MDPVINSLVQSPLVRSMSTVPSKSSSFVHGTRDNVPPFSYQKVVVQPWNTVSQTSQEQSHKFRIPQFGTLNRAYLRIKTVNKAPAVKAPAHGTYPTLLIGETNALSSTALDSLSLEVRLPWTHTSQLRSAPVTGAPLGGGGATIIDHESSINPITGVKFGAINPGTHPTLSVTTDPGAKSGKSSNAWNVLNVLSEMRLTTNGKTVETVYGETIPAEVVKMPEQLREFYTKGMVGWACGDDQGGVLSEPNYAQPWDPSACHRDFAGRLSTQTVLDGANQVQMNRNVHANFIVPVTLSSLKTLAKNYQTRFVEDLELEVQMKELGRGFNVATSSGTDKYHQVELVLIYHNWHDNIENSIRNNNYKRGVPASVYSTNWVRAATAAKFGANDTTLSIPLTSRNLVTEIVLVGKALSIGSIGGIDKLKKLKSDYTMLLDRDFGYNLEFVGSGKTIWSGRSDELHGPDTADYDLTDRRLAGGDCGYGGASKKARTHYETPGEGVGHKITGSVYTSSGLDYTHGGVDFSFGDNMAILRFGFQTTDEYYTGGVALQTISNPTLVVTPVDATVWQDKEIEFDVYVKHANLVRIDSDTGAVTRTLDV